MTPSQRQLIKEAYQEGYQEALHENRFKNFIRKIFGLPVNKPKATRKLSDAEYQKHIQAINQAIGWPGLRPIPAQSEQFRGIADDLYNKALKAVRTNLDDQITRTTPLPDVAQDFLNEMGDLIDDLFKKVQDGELTNNQAILKLMKRYPGFFDNFGTSTGSRFDDLPDLDP